GDSWKHGGGTVWGWMSYSPKLNLFYYGTGNCGPWNPDYRRDPTTAPGLNKYTNKYCSSVLARNATNGHLVWAYQATPQDQWDFDQVDNPFLINLNVNGKQVYALVKSDRNGYFYAWNAATGELLYQPKKYTPVTWSDHVDMTTGEPVMNKDALVYTGQKTGEICPFINGNNWFNDSYNPKTGLVYFNSYNRCNSGFTGAKGTWTPGGHYVLIDFGDSVTGPGGYLGAMQAWNPNTGTRVWSVQSQNYQNRHPLMSTGGNLIFSGTDQGYFQAVNATNGQTIWKFRTGSGFRNSPVSFIGPDGKQYIAVITSEAPSNPAVGDKTAPDDATRYARPGTTLYVFGLP
ncbi:MAG: PQQ-binding-like beta-propeller repeat protein, partial [Deinococcales bacterium]